MIGDIIIFIFVLGFGGFLLIPIMKKYYNIDMIAMLLKPKPKKTPVEHEHICEPKCRLCNKVILKPIICPECKKDIK